MSKWTVESESANTGSVIEQALTVGIAPTSNDYTIRNDETGETREVEAFSKEHLGEKIESGNI